MTLSQTLSVWTLRALLVWALFEGATALYDVVQAKRGQLDTLSSQSATMSKLVERVRTAETAAAEAQSRLGGHAPSLWRLDRGGDPARAAGEDLRQILIDAGAQAAAVDADLATTPAPRLHFSARWQEPVAAPAVITGLAARHPDLQLVALRMNRNGDLINVSAELEANVIARAAP